MAKTSHPEIDSLVDSALKKAVQFDGPVKLYHGKYDEDGLFAQKTGIAQKAARFGFGTEPPLWVEEPRSSMNHVLLVRIVHGGLDRLIENTSSRSRPPLVRSASALYRQDLLERWADLATARGWKDDFPKIADCCSHLIDNLKKLVQEDSGSSPEPKFSDKPRNGEEADFKRRMAHELVIAWKHAPTPEAKQSIANALQNAGVQQIGSPDETLPMDGGLHRCEGPAFPGDQVEVVESGWLIHDGVGEYLLEKAVVRLI